MLRSGRIVVGARLMTDEQLKRLAEMVLDNDAKLAAVSGILANLIERTADAGDDCDGRANVLRSEIDQLAALARDSVIERKKFRRYFGLPDEYDSA
jgi:hypothetical protein